MTELSSQEIFKRTVSEQIAALFPKEDNPAVSLMAHMIENTDMLSEENRAYFYSDLLDLALNRCNVFDIYEGALKEKLRKVADRLE